MLIEKIILLEHPRPINPKRLEDVVNTPLSSCLMTGYIASVLKSRNLGVEIVDANLRGWSFYKTVKELKKKSFGLLGVHLVYLWENTEDVFKMILNLREKDINVHINLYGHFPTFSFKEILSNYPFVDSVTIGEPEITFSELAETVIDHKGSSASLYSIDGLAFNSLSGKSSNKVPFENLKTPPLVKGDIGGFSSSLCKHGNMNESVFKPEIIKNKPRAFISNLDTLPFPYRHNFELLKEKGITTYILASRGCYGKCTFCYLDRFYGEDSVWRGRSPDNVFNEICHLYKETKERYFYFADANFFGPGRKGKDRACELARLIIDKGVRIDFGIECRVNDIEDESISMLVKAGLKDVFLGVESGSQNSLDRFRKFTTIEDNKRAINLLRRYNIEPNYGFIIFEPDSTLEDVRENFEFLKEMKMLIKPSITAHLLHHTQTIFKGIHDFENKKYIAEPVSKFNYEYSYEYKDERVGALSKDINGFCLKILQGLSRNIDLKKQESHSCFYDEDDPFSKKLNKELIEHFEKTLSAFEFNRDTSNTVRHDVDKVYASEFSWQAGGITTSPKLLPDTCDNIMHTFKPYGFLVVSDPYSCSEIEKS